MSKNKPWKSDGLWAAATSSALEEATPLERIEFAEGVGIEVPDAWRTENHGAMRCCGCEVAENERCPVCGDLNFPLP